MDHGVSFDLVTKNGGPPIFYAILSQGSDMLELAVSYGAKLDVRNEDDDTLLDYAIRRDNKEATFFLLECGARFVESSHPNPNLNTTATSAAGM